MNVKVEVINHKDAQKPVVVETHPDGKRGLVTVRIGELSASVNSRELQQAVRRASL